MVEALERHLETRIGIIRLTPRQKEVLQTVADGLSLQESGKSLGISINTVRIHRGNIIRRSYVVGEETTYIKLIKAGILNEDIVNNHPTQPLIPLTPREQDVIKCLYAEKTRKQTCEKLYIENTTLKAHLKSIYLKYRVPNLYAAIAMHAGIIKKQNSS